MITETQADLLGTEEEIDMSIPIQTLFDECLSFISISSVE